MLVEAIGLAKDATESTIVAIATSLIGIMAIIIITTA